MPRSMARPGKNPFRPGRGVLPPLIAGRDRELALAERRLADLADGSSPSQDFLFYGPRGNGKTTMLLEIGRRARECGFRVETLPVAALAEHAKLVRVLQERAKALESQFTGVQALGVGATASPRAPTEDIEALLIAWIGADLSLPALVIVLDEVQELSPEVARWFFEAVQRAKSEAPPFLIVAAGTPDAPRRVLQAATSNERGFRRCRVGRLRRPDTIAALREPAREAGRPLAEDAAEFLAEESQDYPYFLQLLGGAAWDAAATGSVVSLEHAERGVAECAADIEEFYEGRYREAEARRVAPILKALAGLFAAQGGRLADSRLTPVLRAPAEDEVPFDAISLRDELSDLGVLWEADLGIWEMGIPRFADYLLRRL